LELNDLAVVSNRLTKYSIDEQKKAILLDENSNDLKKETTKATNENNKVQEEQQKFLMGSIGWYEKRIKQLKEENELIKSNSKVALTENEEYQTQLSVIEDLQIGLDKLLGIKKDIEQEGGISLDLSDDGFMTEADGDALIKSGEDARKILEDFKKSFVDDFANNSGFGKTFELLTGGLKDYEGDAVATAIAITDAFQEAFNTISSMSQANFDAQRENLEKEKDFDIITYPVS